MGRFARKSGGCVLCVSALLAVASGCVCQSTGGPDAGRADSPEDAPRRRDAWFVPDAYVAPDAGPPFTLIERDSSPCTPIMPAPVRARALPADPTPRVLWNASLRDLGIEGSIQEQGAVDREGGIHFSTALALHRGAELDRDGALLGFGDGISRTGEGRFGPMAILADDRAIEGSGDFLRIDASPPSGMERNLVSFPVPEDFSSGPYLATTSDGFYALRTRGTLRKYCADGRLQWEIPIGEAGGIQTERDDSVWLFGSSNTASLAVRIAPGGSIVEWVRGPDGTRESYVAFAGELRATQVSGPASTTVLTIEREGTVLYQVERATEDSVIALTPSGSVWFRDDNDGSPVWTRYMNGVATSDVAEIGLSPRTMFGDDGSMMFSLTSDDDGNELIRLGPDGRVRWRLATPHGALFYSHDVDGRVYLFSGQHVTAVQTDVLPPAIRGCWQWRCNHLGNNRLEETYE